MKKLNGFISYVVNKYPRVVFGINRPANYFKFNVLPSVKPVQFVFAYFPLRKTPDNVEPTAIRTKNKIKSCGRGVCGVCQTANVARVSWPLTIKTSYKHLVTISCTVALMRSAINDCAAVIYQTSSVAPSRSIKRRFLRTFTTLFLIIVWHDGNLLNVDFGDVSKLPFSHNFS